MLPSQQSFTTQPTKSFQSAPTRQPPTMATSQSSVPPLAPLRTRPPPPNVPSCQPPSAQSPAQPVFSLKQPTLKKGSSRPTRIFRHVRSVFRSFPIITPTCKMPVMLPGKRFFDGHIHGGIRMTGTLFGHRKARVNLAIQENRRSLPILLLELTLPTGKLLQDMGMGLLRIALECEKRPNEKTKILDEPIWTLYCNGKKSGYGVKGEPTDEDLAIMQILHVISMGAGVIPADGTKQPDGELTSMRADFESVIGSRDSETYYMRNPDGNIGPELSILFVRI